MNIQSEKNLWFSKHFLFFFFIHILENSWRRKKLGREFSGLFMIMNRILIKGDTIDWKLQSIRSIQIIELYKFVKLFYL